MGEVKYMMIKEKNGDPMSEVILIGKTFGQVSKNPINRKDFE
jgi:hypothetical protein